MSYTPTEWQTGDTITAEKLNKLENGVADSSGSGGDGNIFTIHYTIDGTFSVTSDKTYTEIQTAVAAGKELIAFCTIPSLTVGLDYDPTLVSVMCSPTEDMIYFMFTIRTSGQTNFYSIKHSADSIVPGIVS